MTEAEILARMQQRVEGSRHRGLRPGSGTVNSSSDDLYGATSEVQSASNAIGTVNPRNPGRLNDLAQSAKKLIQRSLGWYTRSLRSFGAAVSTALHRHTEAISRLAYSVEQNERAVEELSQQAQENLAELHHRVELDLGSVEARARTAESAALQSQEELLRLRTHIEQELAKIRSEVQSKVSELRKNK